jgi:hypothetical protein
VLKFSILLSQVVTLLKRTGEKALATRTKKARNKIPEPTIV